jgi:hypothetical protein
MDKEDREYLNKIIKEYNKMVKQMSERIEQIWKEVIQNEVYDVYDPKEYERTFQLRDKVTSKLVNDTLYVYADVDNMEYFSFGRQDKPVSADAVIHFLDVGHDTYAPFEGDTDMLRHYPARHIIEKFANRVKQEYPEYKIQVFRDTMI